MVTITVRCAHCGSEHVTKYGRAPNGKQKYRCRACGRQSREKAMPQAYSLGRRDEILRAYEERSSLHGLERTFGISPTTVIGWLKKGRRALALEQHAGAATSHRAKRHHT